MDTRHVHGTVDIDLLEGKSLKKENIGVCLIEKSLYTLTHLPCNHSTNIDIIIYKYLCIQIVLYALVFACVCVCVCVSVHMHMV